ncbi:hypothetical protein BO79DRAFT_280995 [Aspergillus costaricaensis CBS 115574]|uniref:Uncharacterized protein n=1 Tax=Aspergillus costaricaensis CBS 115574 TaxID=1448317 RepID=A0ACD1IKF6_9EURO|nr:hypothetical protein BO79DRAFT_280995 [Aspergillus costaricaensis CBS 115574]RAK90829.1 hypothetical protein BO79DRAFT_280995 [Aspergillus costaricaensis CBS 115574]
MKAQLTPWVYPSHLKSRSTFSISVLPEGSRSFQMNRLGTATELRAEDLVQFHIPELRIGDRRTISDSTHNIEYLATLVRWNTFEQEVRQAFEGIQWPTHREVLAYEPPRNATGNNTCHEQLLCGDEHTTVARFGQNVGHIMTSVFQTMRLDARFGDFKTCSDAEVGGKVPDIVLVDDTGKLKVIGEAKTPWMHNIQLQVDQTGQKTLRRYIAKQTTIGPRCDNPMDRTKWVSDKKTRRDYKDEDYISQPELSSEDDPGTARAGSRAELTQPGTRGQSTHLSTQQTLQGTSQDLSSKSKASAAQTHQMPSQSHASQSQNSAQPTSQSANQSRASQPRAVAPLAHQAISQAPASQLRPPRQQTHNVHNTRSRSRMRDILTATRDLSVNDPRQSQSNRSLSHQIVTVHQDQGGHYYYAEAGARHYVALYEDHQHGPYLDRDGKRQYVKIEKHTVKDELPIKIYQCAYYLIFYEITLVGSNSPT